MFEACLKCAICYENCYLEQMGIASFIRLPLQEDASSIWTCSNCWTCQDICPVNIPLMELKWQLQQMIETPPSYAASLENIALCGYCLQIDPEELNPFRLDDGLEPLILASSNIIATLLQTK